MAASDKTDTRATFSNFGSCVEVYAPGVAVTSTWLNGGTNTISGTSMAAPHVAGVAALYKSGGDAASSTINSWIVNNSTSGAISNNPSGTVNRLLFKSTLYSPPNARPLATSQGPGSSLSHGQVRR